jgi:hypothetical protein
MFSPLLDNAPYGAYALLLGLLLKFFYKRIRPWIKTRKEMATDKAETRRQTVTIFSVLVFACSVAFGLLLLLGVTLPQTSPQTPIVRLLAGGAGALCVMGALLMIFGLPAYNYVIDLADRYQNLEAHYRSLDRRNQFLENLCRSFENRNEKLEERLKAIELQGQVQNGGLEEQLPIQRNLAFMDMWSVQKRDHDADLMKQAKADVGRLAGSQR